MQQAVVREIWHSDDTANVLGQPMDGALQGGSQSTGKVYSPEQRITISQAVAAYTRGSAYASFFDNRVGTLEPGKEADIAVLSQDVFTVPDHEIGKTKVVLTLVGGKTVYELSE
jgi:predicted amidohydrolase YtcJ